MPSGGCCVFTCVRVSVSEQSRFCTVMCVQKQGGGGTAGKGGMGTPCEGGTAQETPHRTNFTRAQASESISHSPGLQEEPYGRAKDVWRSPTWPTLCWEQLRVEGHKSSPGA